MLDHNMGQPLSREMAGTSMAFGLSHTPGNRLDANVTLFRCEVVRNADAGMICIVFAAEVSANRI